MHKTLQNQGFSLWCDFVERNFLHQQFPTLIKEGKIFGATSNPSIFAQSFKTSPAYRDEIALLQHKNAKEIYETLAIEDIKTAAHFLRPLYDLDPNNGYISIEIDPLLCDDARASIEEGERLFQAINQPNVMIKVPATQAGYEVMEELLKKSIPINATLVFSPTQAKKCVEAFKKARQFGGVAKSVISIFVSRFDREVNALLPNPLKNKLGIENAKYIYSSIIKDSQDTETRALFASTGVKDKTIRPSYYIDELLLPNSINTAPLESIDAYFLHKDFEFKGEENILSAFQNCNLEALYAKLLQEGLESFKATFCDLLKTLKA